MSHIPNDENRAQSAIVFEALTFVAWNAILNILDSTVDWHTLYWIITPGSGKSQSCGTDGTSRE